MISILYKIAYSILFAFVLTILLNSTAIAADSTTTAAAAKNHTQKMMVSAIGEVVSVKGTVKAMGADKSIRVLKAKSPIFPKDILYTDKSGYAGLRFTDGTLGVVQPDTIMKIDTYKFTYSKDPKAPLSPDDHFKIKLGKGGLDLNAGKIAQGNPGAFLVSTPAGKVRVENSKATIVYKPNQGLGFKGTGSIQNAKGTTKVLNQGYAFTQSATILPLLVTTIPAMLVGADQVVASQLLTQEITEYGESVAYEETASSEEEVTEEEITNEDSSDELSSDEMDDESATEPSDNSDENASDSNGDSDDSGDDNSSDDSSSGDDGSDDGE